MADPTPESTPEPTLADVLAAFERLEARIEAKLDAEVKRWDERFYQLSRDTLNFARNVVVVAAVTAVLIPLFKDVAPLILDTVRESAK